MSRTTQKFPLVLSTVLASLLLLSLVVLCFPLPYLVESLCDTRDLVGDRANMTATQRNLVLAIAYGMIAVAAGAILAMLKLLRTVGRGEVFSPVTNRLISVVSLCCFGEAILFALTGIWFQLSFGAALGLCFVGLCLLIVSNVIREAIRLKAENDLTI